MPAQLQGRKGEVYTNGYDETVLTFMRRRTLSSHGHFIEPLLKPGLRVLDLGCGPGNMTLELTQRVGPQGGVVGVDRHEDQFEGAREASRDLPVTFRAMDAYRLDFENDSFDGVFSHALFEHLVRPREALAEVRRVLKGGGFVGLRSPDWGGMVIHPSDEATRAAVAARLDLQTRNGGNVQAGRHLGEWLRRAGFVSVQVSANYEIYQDNALIVNHLATQMEEDGQVEHAATWKKWGENPDAMFAQAWFEAVGHKETKS
jgi:ubiquinone/menaquinone biosynthesis C-methylase UbiE